MPARPSVRRTAFRWLALIAVTALVGGCATSAPPEVPQARADAPKPTPDELVPVLRYGRYTLVELTAEPPQRALMQQVIDVTIPATANATVGDALRYVLLKSGYQLCEDASAVGKLDSLPLPAAHLHLGPLMLRDALVLLVGGTGQLEIDESTRRVCFLANAPAADEAAHPHAAALAEAHP